LKKDIESSQVKFDIDFSQCNSLWFPVSFLKEIFYHNISNSLIHNANQNDLSISISTTKMLSSTILEIKDNGCGIDQVMLGEGVSEPFRSYSKSESNLGIGLSIVQAIAHVTESVLEIESGSGRGTTIRFYFRQ
jgi:C4-dicarboxylate-specific signal transduction histidine kinase